jgi:hypothetical protein
MEYTEIKKTHVYELLYPFAAKALGLANLFLRNNSDIVVTYHGNKYCGPDDTADNAMSRLTVRCKVRKHGTVHFTPYMDENEELKYNVYVNDDLVARISSIEWELIRPKVYGDFTEYFIEHGKAIGAYQYLLKHTEMRTQPFIISHYRDFVRGFRQTLHVNFGRFTGTTLAHPVEIMFDSEFAYGTPVHEHAVVAKTTDNRLMLITTSLN